MSSIEASARRLKWAVIVLWGILVLAYVVGRFGLAVGPVEVQTHSPYGRSAPLTLVADVSVALLSVAFFHLVRMLGLLARGDYFSAATITAFRAFALWFFVLALAWIVLPLATSLLHPTGDGIEFRLQLRDILILGVTLVLLLVARLLERARLIEDENREIV